jgi:hypothetical protein
MPWTHRWRPLARLLLRLTALGAVGLFLVASIPPALSRSWESLSWAWRLRGEDVASARRRTWGDDYWNGIEAIREAIPPDGEYLLTWTGVPGTDVFTNFDLAPRRAVYLGKLASARRDLAVPGWPADAPAWVVVARGPGQAPRLVSTDAFFGGVAMLQSGREDAQLPCSLEVPAEGEKVPTTVVVRGWCQERGGKPCESVRIFIDGEERAPGRLERYPRPDVEAVVPGIGSCERAGFRAVCDLDSGEAGEHTVTAFFLTADGRYRRLGPRPFVVVPPGAER